jgi:hypothetical protein
MQIFHVAIRGVAFICAMCLLYGGFFLYEDEECKIQNRLEDWWIRLSDRSDEALDRHVLFMQEISRLASTLMDKLFGDELLSVRAFSVQTCYSIASFFVAVLVGFARHGAFAHLGDDYQSFVNVLAAALLCVIVLVLVLVGSVPAFRPRLAWVTVAFSATILLTFATVTFLHYRYFPDWPLAFFGRVLNAFPVALLSEFYVLGLGRKLLRETINLKSLRNICLFIAVIASLTVLIVVIPIWLSFLTDLDFLLVVGELNLLTGVILLLLILLTSLMLLHRLFWPALLRPLYLAQKSRLFAHRKVLIFTGSGFLLIALSPTGAGLKGILEVFRR